MKDWLKPPYNNKNKVLEDSKPGGPLSQEAANVLLGVHERDVNDNPPRQSPSNQDIQLLKDQYRMEYNTLGARKILTMPMYDSRLKRYVHSYGPTSD